MRKLSIIFFLASVFSTNAQNPIGIFEKSKDLGNPKIKGSSSYDPASQTYTLKGGGYNVWFNHDECHFLYKPLKGDFVLTANFELVGNEEGNGHRKTGWMIRADTASDAVSINSCLHGDGLAVLQWRPLKGAFMRDPEEEIFFPKTHYNIIQLERVGEKITMRVAHDGEPFQEMGTATVPYLQDELLVGPYVLSHDPDDEQEARIWNVRITQPVANDFHPNPLVKLPTSADLKLGSRMEVMDVESGIRKIVYESENSRFGSPKFHTDGRYIFFVENGIDFAVSMEGGIPVKQEGRGDVSYNPETFKKTTYFNDNSTGTNQIWKQSLKGKLQQITFDADHDWYPHVSPDGKWIAYLSLAHDTNPKEVPSYSNAMIKIMPVAGGAPKVIAHIFGGKGSFENPCWSPDSKSIVFVTNGIEVPN